MLAALGITVWMLMAMSRQLEAIGNVLCGLDAELKAANDQLDTATGQLGNIERHTARQAKHLYRADEHDQREKETNSHYYAQRDAI
jgi:hypothetical protein